MNNFFHSGATGDIIFSLPTIKSMGGGNLYITNFDKQRSESIKKLIEVQPYINEVIITDGDVGGIDLNKFRQHAGHHVNLVKAHFRGQELPVDESWINGWLTLPKKDITKAFGEYCVINRTTNYEDWGFDWSREVMYLESLSKKIYFIGYEQECKLFNETFRTNVEYLDCDFLEGAYLIKNAKQFTGCYSAWSTIAMGLGIKYRLLQAPNHTCSSLLQQRETIINI
jgi:hypothetical protein